MNGIFVFLFWMRTFVFICCKIPHSSLKTRLSVRQFCRKCHSCCFKPIVSLYERRWNFPKVGSFNCGKSKQAHGNKSRMTKWSDCDYVKRNVSVVLCDTYFLEQLTKSWWWLYDFSLTGRYRCFKSFFVSNCPL